MIAITMGVALLVAILLPNVPLGRAIREFLFELPIRWLKILRRSHWFALFAVLATMITISIYAKTEGAMFFASGLPDIVQWFLVFDVGTYMDVIGFLVLLAASVRFRAVYTVLLSTLNAARRWGLMLFRSLRGRRQARALRRRPTRSQGGPSIDDDESWRACLTFA